MGKLNGLDLFSGYGGGTISLEDWVTTVAYCEKEPYAQAQLLSRMSEGQLSVAPIWDDITTLDGLDLLKHTGPIDIIKAGFPCQDISVAGLGAGLEGKRSGLFFEVMRLAQEIKPSFIFLENVPAIRTRGLREVGQELASIGYDSRWHIVSAREVGANHLRKRWFCLANTNSKRLERQWESSRIQEEKPRLRNASPELPDSMRKRLGGEATTSEKENNQREWEDYWRSKASSLKRDWWCVEPNVGRVVNGSTFRMDRIKQLGNGVVPLQEKTAFKRLLGLEKRSYEQASAVQGITLEGII